MNMHTQIWAKNNIASHFEAGNNHIYKSISHLVLLAIKTVEIKQCIRLWCFWQALFSRMQKKESNWCMFFVGILFFFNTVEFNLRVCKSQEKNVKQRASGQDTNCLQQGSASKPDVPSQPAEQLRPPSIFILLHIQ